MNSNKSISVVYVRYLNHTPEWLGRHVTGRITGNGSPLAMFHREVTRTWRKWLSRRHRRGGYPWPQFTRLLERYPLPRPVVVHSVYRRAANP